MTSTCLFLAVTMVVLAPVVAGAAPADHWPAPGHRGPTEWTVIGPFPNAEATAPDQPRPGLDRDYLESLGGEAEARVDAGTSVSLDGQTYPARPATMNAANAIDLRKLFGEPSDLKVAYAYAEWDAASAQTLHARFGSDDGAAVWLNGQRVHRAQTPGREMNLDSDQFDLPVRAGTNRLLVKVENGTGGWAFGLQVLDDEGQRRRQAIALRRDLGAADPGPRSNRYLLTDSFPKLVWRNESAGRAIFGDAPMEVRWFGPDLNEVEQPDKPGRYTAVVEATTVDGLPYRRMLAFAKVPPNFLPRFGGLPLVEPPLLRLPPEGVRLSGPLNAAQEAELSRHLWAAAGEYFAEGEGAAVAAAALLELADPSAATAAQDRPPQLAGGHVRNVEHQLRLRMKLEGRKPKPLPPPKTLDTPAPELRTGSEGEAGLKPGTVDRLGAVCEEWIKDDPNGFVVLVARRGVVVMHEGFGGFDKDQHFRPASIGKTIAGLTFARAVDEGNFTLDQKVGDVLPDWNQPPTSDVTFRALFNHMDGLRGHHTLDGLFSAYLDNGLFVQDGAFADPLKRRHYNGDDHNLAGMALQLATGQTIMQLLYEQMQKPFGEPVTQCDLGFGEAFTAQYLAEVGQMLLQDGKYGPHQFFKPGLVEQLTPKRVSDYVPEAEDKQLEWGIGLEWMIDPPGPRERGVLGPNVFGHGAASASVWRIAPDHDLLVVIGRNEFKTWNGTNDWAAKFMTALAEGMRE